jgi:hypothetical protein
LHLFFFLKWGSPSLYIQMMHMALWVVAPIQWACTWCFVGMFPIQKSEFVLYGNYYVFHWSVVMIFKTLHRKTNNSSDHCKKTTEFKCKIKNIVDELAAYLQDACTRHRASLHSRRGEKRRSTMEPRLARSAWRLSDACGWLHMMQPIDPVEVERSGQPSAAATPVSHRLRRLPSAVGGSCCWRRSLQP